MSIGLGARLELGQHGREPTHTLVSLHSGMALLGSVAQTWEFSSKSVPQSVPQSGTHLGNGWKITGRLIWILMRAGRCRKEVKTHEETIYKIKEGVIKKE